ncbi:MAG: hypothetical protein A3C50_01280 [Candidatus Staskawiczbacteria bacterium RIFCSPHIGHO2_02_FULL_43_16]|uniref:Uncharacterized protein n=1 Tax=Candidatus Staskawiczbacteria bacterium RIFCSPHIGHO2_01_FULL_41_41 TaxID=1802203 RepID=A0A1G2HV87_9BACT|nr:MAG: hypothetical protein A2822_04635 [Candidatus Staskawiczbacteria bacterium RIFCSPHIGHO2_01_FULL_41_41]OGZ68840.1 MAG: hypothetical protein A3C50_01280 [Candidatus Staskawiczbacteria bacterium RIFCSPHIGHO2_02_FULL_43_16]OGZ74213.1 MAG: hypothetical protein A3A12_00270 [Candidatus Staskawiczbacteria bacterium RIFCSPLOWO2_01_FULL_43_17b]
MISIGQTDDFRKKLEKLPKSIVRLYTKQKYIFELDWRDSRLHVKKLVDLNGYSFRITRNYRVLFYFQDDKRIIFVDIGHRKDIYE